MEKTKKLIIVGIGETADIAHEYFTYDSAYEVIGFSVNKEFINNPEFKDLPVYDFENLEKIIPPARAEVYVAISYTHLNRVRAKKFYEVKSKGYTCASYLSSHSFVWRNTTIGENVFVFENNVIQHHAKISDNVLMWSGNHIGHRSIIREHVYLSSHCVISGMCEIGEYSFLGVNCAVNDHIKIGKDNIIGSGALIVKNTEDGKLMIGAPAKPAAKSSYEAFGVPTNEI